jgi:hypothetical protein
MATMIKGRKDGIPECLRTLKWIQALFSTLIAGYAASWQFQGPKRNTRAIHGCWKAYFVTSSGTMGVEGACSWDGTISGNGMENVFSSPCLMFRAKHTCIINTIWRWQTASRSILTGRLHGWTQRAFLTSTYPLQSDCTLYGRFLCHD